MARRGKEVVLCERRTVYCLHRFVSNSAPSGMVRREARPLTRKAFAALCYLVAHAGQLDTKEELIEAVWAVPYVSDTVPRGVHP